MAGQDRANEYLRSCRTNAKDGFLMSSYAIDYVFRGKTFSVVDYSLIAGSATEYYVFDTTGTGYLVVQPPTFSCTGGPIIVRIYAGTDYTGVNALNFANRDVNSSVLPVATLKNGATGTDKGTLMVAYIIPAGHKSAGSASDSLPYVFDGVKYLIEVENLGVAETYFGYNFTWFED